MIISGVIVIVNQNNRIEKQREKTQSNESDESRIFHISGTRLITGFRVGKWSTDSIDANPNRIFDEHKNTNNL